MRTSSAARRRRAAAGGSSAAAVFVAILCSSPLLALAQQQPASPEQQPAVQPGQQPAPPPPVIPPRIDPAPEVMYPESGKGDAEVILVLVIGRDGRVRSAEVEKGDEPFASAAKQAAMTWQFTPATRGGEPIGAKIKFALTFREPPEAPPPEDPAATSGATPQQLPRGAVTAGAAAKPAAPPAPKIVEVLVLGERPPPSVRTMTRAEVRQLPGAFGDPFRAIEAMPGVTPIVSGLPFFYVRGAPPGNIGYYLDGVRVPYLFHAAAGPSVIHPGLVDHVDLYSGGYPARFGRYAGAVVGAETTQPTFDWHGEGNLRLVDVGGLVEGTFAENRGSALVAGRYSYTAAVISLISPELRLDYRDYQARVSYQLSGRDRITLFAFGSYDLLAQEKNGIETILFGSEFYRVDARYDAALPNEGKLRLATTWGFDQTRVADQRNARDLLWNTRVELNLPMSPEVTLRSGVNVEFDNYEADAATYGDPEDPDVIAFNNLFPSRADSTVGFWADVVWRPNPRIEITPGVRVDVFQSAGASAVGVDPRLGVTVELSRRVKVLHALGVAHQPPSFIVPVPGLALASLRGGLQRSLQTAAGVEVELPAKITATATVFNNIFLNMTDTAGVRPPGDDQNQVPRSLGTARGLEIYVRRNLSAQLGGYLSYTLSRSTRTLGQYEFPYAFDRTHVFNTALAYDLGRRWRAGARFTFYTGVPDLDPPSDPFQALRYEDPPREPSFYRIDARVEKKWVFAKERWLSFVVEILNATFNKETVNGEEIGPVSIPSIGLEGGF
jgi:hypothetical protein